MVAELSNITAAATVPSNKSVCSSERLSNTLPRWLQTATRDSEINVQPMYAGITKIPKNNGIGYRGRDSVGERSDVCGVGTDPASLLSRSGIRSVVGLVGPYRRDIDNVDDSMEGCERVVNGESPENPPPRSFVLRDEELIEESEFRRIKPDSSTPGRENWRLQESHKLGNGPGDNGVLSMTDIWPKDWGMYNEQPEQDSLNEQSSCPERQSSAGATPAVGGKHRYRGNKLGPGRTLLGILSSGRSSTSDMFDYKEPFSSLWVLLSSLYGRLVVILMLAFCLTEVMDNSVKLLSLQGIFLMYLYVGSIAVIICIYIWVLIDSCATLNSHNAMKNHAHGLRMGMQPATITTSVMDRDAEMGGFGFGSLKKAHISRARTSATSFYLRVGALAFGLGTLVFNGLEMAMHSMMEGPCLSDVVFVHPVLHGLFTFLQMHFLFVNSQVLVERFGLAARFGFMHLAATNLALWIRLIVWESGNEWTYFIYLAQSVPELESGISSNIPTPLQLRGFPRSMLSRHERDLSSVNVSTHHAYQPVSNSHISQVVALHECLNTNSLGQLWTSSMPFLYPFIVQFSLIAAAVTFVMGQNVGRSRLLLRQKKFNNNNSFKCSPVTSLPERSVGNNLSVDCSGASKGLFLGLLCMVAGIVVIIIFLVVKEDMEFPTDTIFWMTTGALTSILSISFIMTLLGLWQIRRLSVDGYEPSTLDSLLATVTTTGVQLYTVFGIVVGASGLANSNASSLHGHHGMLLAVSLLQLLQSSSQSTLVSEALRRASLTRHQMLLKPGRQVITFLLCANAVLWGYDTFVTQSWMSQELQLRFYGVLAWGCISRIGLPLLVFYRFHSCVLLLEVWKRSYRTPLLDPGN